MLKLTPNDIRILESIPPAGFAALLRGKKKKKPLAFSVDSTSGKESNRIFESAEILKSTDAVKDPAKEGQFLSGPVVEVVLITEGLGNMRDKNYYGPECIRSAPTIFEGSWMNADHASYSEEQDIPEGRIKKRIAYYKNVRAEMVQTPTGPKLGLVAEAHFDLSQEGLNAYQKAKTAVHYRDEFPAKDREYVGISVNAFGESEPRQMTIDGQTMEVNYVMRFGKESSGADMVTIPARGGHFRRLMEDIFGARISNEEVRMKKLLKRLESARAEYQEAQALKDPDLREKKSLEAQKGLDEVIKDIREASLKPTEAEVMHDPEDPDCECEACKGGETTAGGEAAPEKPATHMVTHTTKSTGKAAVAAAGGTEEAEATMEAHRIAVDKLIADTGIDAKYFDTESLYKAGFKEAKQQIASQKRMHEAAVETVLKRVGNDVRVSHRTKESAGGGTGNEPAENNAEFPVLAMQ